MNKKKILLVAACAALPALADDAGLQRCRAIADSAQRLACYDALPIAPPSAARAAPSPAASSAAPAAGAPAAAPAQSQSPASRFGFEQRTQPDEPPTLESYIPGKFEGWGPKSVITLANGQAWQVIDDSARFANLQNPKVTLRRGMLGSFFLDIAGVNPSPRVRRVQ
jgi:hypothetical protein